jgi:hypothetical protein
MRQRLNLRLKALEKWLSDETKPHKAPLPEWLIEEYRQQGIQFDASGRPEKNSIEENRRRAAHAAEPRGGGSGGRYWDSYAVAMATGARIPGRIPGGLPGRVRAIHRSAATGNLGGGHHSAENDDRCEHAGVRQSTGGRGNLQSRSQGDRD